MANNCGNWINISGINKETIAKIGTWVESYNEFNYVGNWVNSLIPISSLEYVLAPARSLAPLSNKVIPQDAYDYGGRWFEAGVDSAEETEMQISGDSAWSPMLGMCKIISEVFECTVNICYEESGNGFGGETEYVNGVEDIKFDGSYTGYLYYEQGIHRLIENYEWVEDKDDYDSIVDDVKAEVSVDDMKLFREAFAEFDDVIKLQQFIDKL
jgi:hypothetical protein